MATVEVLTKARMLAIEASSVVDGTVDVDGHLILTQHDGTFIDAGMVVGPKGDDGVIPSILIAFKPAEDLPDTYPTGVSIFSIGSGTTWPANVATLLTVRNGSLRTYQQLVTKATGRVMIRAEDTNTWGAWVEMAPLATNAEVLAGTSLLKAVTPSGLRAALDQGYLLKQAPLQFITSGTFTKASYPGLRGINVKAIGSGGAGSGATANAGATHSKGSGGGSGGYAERFILFADIPSSVTITIPAGGSGVSGAAGNSGSTASFGSLVVAGGGEGGVLAASSAVPGFSVRGGQGGTATVGDILIPGNAGTYATGSTGLGAGGTGAPGPLGGGSGLGGAGAAGGGSYGGGPATGYGAGGGGGASNQSGGTAVSGGAGGAGLIIVELYV